MAYKVIDTLPDTVDVQIQSKHDLLLLVWVGMIDPERKGKQLRQYSNQLVSVQSHDR